MSRYSVEYVMGRECDVIEGHGAWCVVERKRTHVEVVSQHGDSANNAMAKLDELQEGVMSNDSTADGSHQEDNSHV